jgi:hypothetical protein
MYYDLLALWSLFAVTIATLDNAEQFAAISTKCVKGLMT